MNSGPMPRTRLVVMAKEPVPGRVKTRLTPELSEDSAAALYAAFLADTLNESTCAEMALECFVTPDSGREWFSSRLPEGWGLRRQEGADLASRMIHCFDELFSEAASPVVMRNSDSPTLPRSLLLETSEVLRAGAADVVLGPDRGGGYYLVGLGAPAPALFREVAMSTDSMHERTLEVARARGLHVHELEAWLDVDHPADLGALASELSRNPEARRRCPQTLLALALLKQEVPDLF